MAPFVQLAPPPCASSDATFPQERAAGVPGFGVTNHCQRIRPVLESRAVTSPRDPPTVSLPVEPTYTTWFQNSGVGGPYVWWLSVLICVFQTGLPVERSNAS